MLSDNSLKEIHGGGFLYLSIVFYRVMKSWIKSLIRIR